MINSLDEAREAENLTKADVARALHAEPATIRRLFSSTSGNPTLGTLAEVAAVVGMRITVEPMAKAERSFVTAPLRSSWKAKVTRSVSRKLHALRSGVARHRVSS